MERELGILVLMVDAIEGISGAACRLPDLDAVLINRNEVVGRRHFDLAHELFHILTWDTMPPEHVEEASERSKIRVEQLANSFASAVLMPTAVLDQLRDGEGKDLSPGSTTTAEALRVTATALKWRLVAVGRLDLRAGEYDSGRGIAQQWPRRREARAAAVVFESLYGSGRARD